MNTLVVLDRVKGLVDAQPVIIALLIDAIVDRLVDADSTALYAVIHVFVTLVQNLFAAANASLYLTGPGSLPIEQLLDFIVGRT